MFLHREIVIFVLAIQVQPNYSLRNKKIAVYYELDLQYCLRFISSQNIVRLHMQYDVTICQRDIIKSVVFQLLQFHYSRKLGGCLYMCVHVTVMQNEIQMVKIDKRKGMYCVIPYLYV